MVAGTKAGLCSLQTPLRFLIKHADGCASCRLALAVNYGPREPSVCGVGAALALTPSDKTPPGGIRHDVAEPPLLLSDELYLILVLPECLIPKQPFIMLVCWPQIMLSSLFTSQTGLLQRSSIRLLQEVQSEASTGVSVGTGAVRG